MINSIDTKVFLFINGLAGKVRVIDEFFKGVSNDYFPLVTACLVLIWLWFSARDIIQREKDQRMVLNSIISLGVVSGFMVLVNNFYFRARPFQVLSSDSVNLLFYMPTDSSFPSNLAAVIFAIAIPVFIKNKTYGTFLLVLAILSSFGRVYIGVHYPLDVIAGAGLGLISGILAIGISWVIRPVINFMLGFLQKYHLA
jgi:undecaprenyl-diphosphatase